MKLALLALFALSTTLLPLAMALMAPEQVMDTSGNAIFPGRNFYIMPALFGVNGGGVKFGITGNQFCPVTVLQDYSGVEIGAPVKFAIKQDIGPGMIFTGTPLAISFTYSPGCVGAREWVAIDDDSEAPAFVGFGNHIYYSGQRIIDGVFKIEKAGQIGFYKLVFCPTATAPPGLCYDIGRRNDRYGWRLVLLKDEVEDAAFTVVFVDAGNASSGHKWQPDFLQSRVLHIANHMRPTGRRIKARQNRNSKCLVTILQDYSEINNGFPVKFTIKGTSTLEIYEGTRGWKSSSQRN
ncbi:hypothetical protein PIB30_041362 [Stylosanthes scabra]|uniref:Uncharacterized protein n=1 Tax=Stylosanthes scabra TaxID=79078 RepID=A0ABU6ZDL7_9FABA|nr:hypothetical protein [Stylosanthes scabra]